MSVCRTQSFFDGGRRLRRSRVGRDGHRGSHTFCCKTASSGLTLFHLPSGSRRWLKICLEHLWQSRTKSPKIIDELIETLKRHEHVHNMHADVQVQMRGMCSRKGHAGCYGAKEDWLEAGPSQTSSIRLQIRHLPCWKPSGCSSLVVCSPTQQGEETRRVSCGLAFRRTEKIGQRC